MIYCGFCYIASCSRVETVKHCFIECPRIVPVWDFFAPFLSRLLGSPFSPSFMSVLFPLSTSQSSPRLLLFRYLIASILYYVWQARNSATFRNSHLTSRAIVDLITNNIRLRILGEPFDKVKYFWSLGGIFCSTDANGKISFSNIFFSFPLSLLVAFIGCTEAQSLYIMIWFILIIIVILNPLVAFIGSTRVLFTLEPLGRLHWLYWGSEFCT